VGDTRRGLVLLDPGCVDMVIKLRANQPQETYID